MSAGLRVLETRDPQGLTFSDVTDRLKELREQKQKEAEARGKQRLKDIEAVNNDLKTPFFRDQVSSHVDEYVANRYEVGDTEQKSQAEKMVLLNMMNGLREIDNNLSAAVADSEVDFGIYTDDVNAIMSGTSDLPKDLQAIEKIYEYIQYGRTQAENIEDAYKSSNMRLIASDLLQAQEKEKGNTVNVDGKNFVQIVQRLDEENVRDLSNLLATRVGLQKGYENQLGRPITAEEFKELTYNDLQKLLPLKKYETLTGPSPKKDDSGSGLDSGFQIEEGEEDVRLNWEDAKRSGFESVKTINLPNADAVADVSVTVDAVGIPNEPASEDNPIVPKSGKITRFTVGKEGDNIGKPVAIVEIPVSVEGVKQIQKVEVPYNDIKSSFKQGVRGEKGVTEKDKNNIIDSLDSWESRVKKEMAKNKLDKPKYEKAFSALADIAMSDLTDAQKSEEFKKILPNADVSYVSGIMNDIKINGESYPLFTGGMFRDAKPVSGEDMSDAVKAIYGAGVDMDAVNSRLSGEYKGEYTTPDGEAIEGWDDLSDSEKKELIDSGLVVEKK